MWMFIIVFIILGLIGAISPRTSWLMSNWWRFQGNAEPSEASLIIYRAGGIVMLFVSLILIIKLNI